MFVSEMGRVLGSGSHEGLGRRKRAKRHEYMHQPSEGALGNIIPK